MKERVLKYTIYIAGLIGLAAFILVRFESVPEALKVNNVKRFGDLYKMNYIADFDELLPPPGIKFHESELQSNINDADVLIFGDSFFEYDKNKNVPELVCTELNKKVYFEQNPFPLNSLQQLGYRKAGRKKLIFEIAERGLPELFGMKLDGKTGINLDFNYKGLDAVYVPDAEKKYSTILEKSVFTYSLHKMICTFKFRYLGFIPIATPVYSLDPPFLFYNPTVNDEPGSFYYHYTQEEMNFMVEKIENLKDDLLEQYNLELMLVIVPNKYTIHHDIVNDHQYNEFIPIITSQLKDRSVNCVDLLEIFEKSEDLLYYPTDTHWNENGISLAFEEIKISL